MEHIAAYVLRHLNQTFMTRSDLGDGQEGIVDLSTETEIETQVDAFLDANPVYRAQGHHVFQIGDEGIDTAIVGGDIPRNFSPWVGVFRELSGDNPRYIVRDLRLVGTTSVDDTVAYIVGDSDSANALWNKAIGGDDLVDADFNDDDLSEVDWSLTFARRDGTLDGIGSDAESWGAGAESGP